MHWRKGTTGMTVNYITEPIPSAMGKGKGGWRGKIVNRSSRSLEEIAAAVAKRTGWSAYQVQSVFTGVMEETIRDAQETGNVQRLGDCRSTSTSKTSTARTVRIR